MKQRIYREKVIDVPGTHKLKAKKVDRYSTHKRPQATREPITVAIQLRHLKPKHLRSIVTAPDTLRQLTRNCKLIVLFVKYVNINSGAIAYFLRLIGSVLRNIALRSRHKFRTGR